MPTLTESRPPQLHQQHSYRMNPPTPVGCEVVWSINGENVALGSTVGGLSVKGFGASGEMTVEVEGDVSNTEVTATLRCPGAQPDPAGPMAVGTGAWPPPLTALGPPDNDANDANIAPFLFNANEWSWWDRFGGSCPKKWTDGNVHCTCDMTPTYEGLWPFYYKVICTFKCPPFQVRTLTWTLSFGFVISGPD